MTRHHLTDTELLALHFDKRSDGDAQDHVAVCATCRSRGRAVTELLDRVGRDSAAEADAAFGADQLARQHARIMSRLAQECRSARIISFPAAAAQAPVRPVRGGTRWVAAAVAAGVILGIVGEHVTERLRGTRVRRAAYQAPPVQVVAEPGIAVRTVSTGSDDEFYGQVELAFGSAGPAALRPLDVLTPRVTDVRE